MAFSEKISLIVDVVTGNAQSQLGTLKTKMAEAEGGFGKLKAAGSTAFDSIASSPAALVGAGVVVGKFAIDSIKHFSDVALAADKFRDSTGLSLDMSSRWIAVADDVNVSSDTIRTAFGKMEKAIGTNRDAFGTLVKTAKDGSVDLSGTFLNVIGHLQKIPDPIQRATEASKLFGRGYAEVSDIISTDADKLRQKLQDVSDAQIIDESEVSKARDFQAAVDTLMDSWKDFRAQVGEGLVGDLTSTIQGINDVVSAVQGLSKATGGELGNAFKVFENVVNPVAGAKNAIMGLFSDSKSAAEDTRNVFSDAMDAVGGFADEAVAGIGDVGAAWDELRGQLSDDQAVLNLQDAFQKAGDTAVEAWNKTQAGEKDAHAAVRDHQDAIIQLKQKVIDYGQQVAGLPAKKVTDILALIDQGKIAQAEAALNSASRSRSSSIYANVSADAAERALNNVSRNRTADIFIVTHGGAGYGTAGVPRAGGGAVVGGGLYTMGENGPEMVTWDASGKGRVTPADTTARMMGGATSGGDVHVHVSGSVVTEKQLVDAIHQGLIAKRRRSGDLGLAS